MAGTGDNAEPRQHGLPFVKVYLVRDSTDCPTHQFWSHLSPEHRGEPATGWQFDYMGPFYPSVFSLSEYLSLDTNVPSSLTHSLAASASSSIPGLQQAFFTTVVVPKTLHRPRTSCFVVFSVKYCYGLPLTEFTVFAMSRSCLPSKNLEWPIKDTLCKFGMLYSKLHVVLQTPMLYITNSKMWYSLWNQQPTHGTILVFYCCIANCSKLGSLKQHSFVISQILWFKSLGIA